jgi:hypothetical protein
MLASAEQLFDVLPLHVDRRSSPFRPLDDLDHVENAVKAESDDAVGEAADVRPPQ